MMDCEEARAIGEELCLALRPGCERIEIAGSVRRQKPVVKDLELVVLPRMGVRQAGFWGEEAYSLFEAAVDAAIEAGVLARDEETPRWGTKYKRAVHCWSGLVVEMFVAQRHTWGYILALRTGPGDFNKVWASHAYYGGCLPLGLSLVAGELLRYGELVPVETEEAFFEEIGLPCWEPHERSVEKLEAWLKGR